MTETNINLGCAKINIKRDTKHYAPWYVINPRILNPIPEGAKTYKLSPSTTLFFKRTRCAELKFGWRKIKIKPIQKEEKNMSYNYMGTGNSQKISRGNVQECTYFSEREYAAVDRTFRNNYTVKWKTKLALLHENRAARKAMSFWQKTQVFFTEANYDITRFFTYNVHPRYRSYSPYASTPGDRLTAAFLKQNKMDKEDRNTFSMNAQKACDRLLIFLRDDGSIEAKERADKMRAARKRDRSFFQQKTKKIKKIKKPNSVQSNMTVAIRRRNVQPDAPDLPQPSYNPEHQHQEGTTINNYHITICSIL